MCRINGRLGFTSQPQPGVPSLPTRAAAQMVTLRVEHYQGHRQLSPQVHRDGCTAWPHAAECWAVCMQLTADTDPLPGR